MKVRTFRAPGPVVASVAQGRTILRGLGHLAWQRRWFFPFLTLVVIALALLLFPHDRANLAWMHAWSVSKFPSTLRLAAFLGKWGDYLTYNLPLSVLIWLYGLASRQSAWRRVAIICFFGGTLGGLGADFFRLTLGRPRPDAHLPDGFYGLPAAWSTHFESFPSGHAAAVFGTAMALLPVHRLLGFLTTLFAFSVVWARMELYRHYPSDILVGISIGTTLGLLVGFGANVRRPARKCLAAEWAKP